MHYMYKQVKLKPGNVVAGSCALVKTLSDILALAKFAFVISVQSFDAENFWDLAVFLHWHA